MLPKLILFIYDFGIYVQVPKDHLTPQCYTNMQTIDTTSLMKV